MMPVIPGAPCRPQVPFLFPGGSLSSFISLINTRAGFHQWHLPWAFRLSSREIPSKLVLKSFLLSWNLLTLIPLSRKVCPRPELMQVTVITETLGFSFGEKEVCGSPLLRLCAKISLVEVMHTHMSSFLLEVGRLALWALAHLL